MLKFYRNVLAAGVVALGLAACGDNVTVTNPPTSTPVVHGVTVVPASVTATVGQAGVTFVASVNADSGISSAVTWSSTNQTVATVSSAGVITALTPGQTTIVATSVGDPTKTGAGSLQVVALPPNISSFTATPPNANLAVGGSLQASTQSTQPAGAPALTVAWTSSNSNIASVSATGQITGVSAGTAVITATGTSGTQTATATVGITVGTGPTGVISFSVSPQAMTLFSGQSQQATATVVMAPTFTAPTVTWTSLAPTVATVNSTGLVTAVAQGTAVITASIGSGAQTLTQSIVVTVAQSASISIAAVNAGPTAGTVPGCSGIAGLPVVIANVNCQIDVVLNLSAGAQPLDSLNIYIQRGTVAAGAPTFQGKASPTCAAASAPCAFYKLATKQVYGGTIPSTGPVTLSVFTQAFTKNPATGVAVVDYFNGPTSLISQLFPKGIAGGQVTDCQIAANDATCSVIGSMIFTNTDGWAADIFKCTTATAAAICAPAVVSTVAPGGTNASTGGFAVAAGNGNVATVGSTFWGGPTNSGMTTAELYPVVYNDNPGFPSGSALNRCNNTLGNGTGCITSVTWTIGAPNVANAVGPVFGANCGYTAVSTQTTQPFVQRFGSGTGAAINPCAGYQNVTAIRDNITMANSGAAGVFIAPLDGTNNPYPAVGVATSPAFVANTTLIPNVMTFASTPDSARFDYCLAACSALVGGPGFVTAPQVGGAEAFNWVNQNWVFRPAGTVVTDFGVGPAQVSWNAFASANGAPGAPTTFPTLIVNGAAPLAETNTNCTIAVCGAGADGYLAKAWATDLLGNFAGSATTASFGEDRTSPLVRYSDPAAPSSYASIYTKGGILTVMDSTSYNAFQGIYGADVVTAGAQQLFIGAAAGANDSFRIESIDGRSGVSRFVQTVRRFAQGGATGATTTIQNLTTGVGGATVDGWISSLAMNVINGRLTPGVAPVATPGYYTTTGYVMDRAGNVSGCPTVPAAAGGNPTGTILGTTGFIASICPAGAATTVPSTTAGTNLAMQAGGGTNANLFFRRTLALDPGQPLVTGVSPNNAYTGNSFQTFTLGAQDDLEVIDSRLRILYPNLTIGDAAGTVPAAGAGGLVWSYALSGTFMGSSPNGATGTGPSAAFPTGLPLATTAPFGYFLPIGIKFDNSIINPIVTGNAGIPAMTLDQFTLAVQETCLASATPASLCAAGSVNGDPETIVATTKPTNIGVQVRDVFGSWIYNTTASAVTGVSAEFVSAILPATVTTGANFAVTYINPPLGATSSCPKGGAVVAPPGLASCVGSGVNFRAEPSLSTPGSVEVFRATESLSTTLPIWNRVDLFGLNAAGQWVFISRCAVPAVITVNAGAQACGAGITVTGIDNGNERYWLYSFSGVSGGFTAYRALGVNSAGNGLFSTSQP